MEQEQYWKVAHCDFTRGRVGKWKRDSENEQYRVALQSTFQVVCSRLGRFRQISTNGRQELDAQ